jgi:hypothetical protein
MEHILFLHSRSDLVKNNCLFEYQQELHHKAGGFVVIKVAKVITHFVFAFFLHQPVFAVDDVEHVYSIVLDVLHMLEYLQSFEHYNSSHDILLHANDHDKHKRFHLLSLQVLRCSHHRHNAAK